MYACIDIGGTAIKAGVLNKDGTIATWTEIAISQNAQTLIFNIVSWINAVKENYPLKGVCISSPGAVDTKTGTVGGASAIPCIHTIHWKDVIFEKTGLPVSIENDANCAALAEYFYGKAKGIEDVVFIVCGTGIGGSILKNGLIHKGNHLHGGEFGYMIMEEKDGEYRTFSDIASTLSFVRKIRKHYQDDSWDGIKVFESAQKGNKFCQEAIDIFYMNLAKGIFNIQYIYDPECIILSGAISNRIDFIDKINEKIDVLMQKIKIANVRPTICSSTHKKDSNLLGALAHFLCEQNQWNEK